MADVITLNRYIANYGQTKMNVDAPDMVTAAKVVIGQKGLEPNTLTLSEVGISVAQKSLDVTFQIIVQSIDAEVPGDVYPREGSVSMGAKVYVTAVPRDGYKFKAFTTPTGTVVGTDNILELVVSSNTQVMAIFDKLATSSNVGATTVQPS